MRVAIIGMGPGGEDTRTLVGWKRWTHLQDPVMRSYGDRVFAMHPGGDQPGREAVPDMPATTIYWPERHTEIVGECRFVPYPLEDVVRTIGRDFFECSAAYMVALAIHEGYDEIGLWGIHMERDSEEYAWQRPNLSWLLGLAEGRGIRITIPEGCALLSWSGSGPYSKRYGYAA